jgi:hypothetical protein
MAERGILLFELQRMRRSNRPKLKFKLGVSHFSFAIMKLRIRFTFLIRMVFCSKSPRTIFRKTKVNRSRLEASRASILDCGSLSSISHIAFVLSENPERIPQQSPGLPSWRGYPGRSLQNCFNPERVVSNRLRVFRNPRWGSEIGWRLSQGSSFLATLGFITESRWDSTTAMTW